MRCTRGALALWQKSSAPAAKRGPSLHLLEVLPAAAGLKSSYKVKLHGHIMQTAAAAIMCSVMMPNHCGAQTGDLPANMMPDDNDDLENDSEDDQDTREGPHLAGVTLPLRLGTLTGLDSPCL